MTKYKNKFELELISLLRKYVEDPTDLGFHGVFGSNGERLDTRNPKTVEGFLQWLEAERD